MRRSLCSLAAALILAAPALAQPVTPAFTYQGEFRSSGTPLAGPVDLRFSLFTAASGGAQIGATIDLPNTPLQQGRFASELDFGPSSFNASSRFLEIQVRSPAGSGAYVTLAPRQKVTAAPVAQFALAGNPGPTGPAGPSGVAGATGPQGPTGVQGTPGATGSQGIPGVSGATGPIGPSGPTGATGAGTTLPFAAAGNSPVTFDISNANTSAGSMAIRGFHTALTSNTYGVFGVSNSTAGIGVLGRAANSSGDAKGVYGQSASTIGTGVYGIAHAITGANFGVQGHSTSPAGIGVYGEGDTTTGANVGVQGLTNSTTGTGVLGSSVATTGVNYGLRGQAVSGYGLYAEATGTTGVNVGVLGKSASASGFGGWFTNTAGGVALHVEGEAELKCMQILGGCDVAEPFDVSSSGPTPIIAGMVVAIDPDRPGDLRLSDTAYDTRVAGIISGANNLNPGMLLRSVGQMDGDYPVAMTGRVWCYADATSASIRPGDRLTTSATPGHAMRADDSARSQGAVIGKAMTELKEGKGFVLVLVNLQ